MTVRRLVLPEGALGQAEGLLQLPDDLAHYVRSVLRLRHGTEVVVCDGAGQEAPARVVRVGKDSVQLEVGTRRVCPRPLGPEIALIQAVGKGDKIDGVVRQASELGVRRIIPIVTARAVAEHAGRLERWRAIAEDAIRVSGRAFRPVIEPVTELREVLARPRLELALCLDGSASSALGDLAAKVSYRRAEVLIGPEGGFEGSELEAAKAAGFQLAHLGPHTLRTETAGAAACSILLFLGGALGGGLAPR